MHFCWSRLPRVRFPILRLLTSKAPIDRSSLEQALELAADFVHKGLKEGEGFLIVYDVRFLALPTRAQLKQYIGWVGLHRETLDEHLEGVAIILSNSVVRYKPIKKPPPTHTPLIPHTPHPTRPTHHTPHTPHTPLTPLILYIIIIYRP